MKAGQVLIDTVFRAFGLAVLLLAPLTRVQARDDRNTVAIDADDIGGVVTSANGREAGVWVIAETTDLPTKFVRIVVTDDQGRYVIPDLPKAKYKVWVRGYGLVDSQPVQSAPGKLVNLKAVVAPDPRAAAQYYPAMYWYSMLEIPPKSDFPGTGRNGISENMKSQAQWIEMMKADGCENCHQIGDKATREIPESLGHFDSSVAAWERRLDSAQVGPQMIAILVQMGPERALKMFADWTDRVAAGEYPKEVPPRPQGIERNVVITEWDWGGPKLYFHDEVSTDRRDPTRNANGPIYGTHEKADDFMSVLDPVNNVATEVHIPVRDPNTPYTNPMTMVYPSPYWGDELTWTTKANAHSIVIDAGGRVWLTSTIRPSDNPAFCRKGSTHPSAVAFPVEQSNREVSLYDPRTKVFTSINTCFGTQHLNFAEDANDTLWFANPGRDEVGWLNTKMFLETHDEEKSQGWTPMVLDTNGSGKRDSYVEPNEPVDPTKDKRIRAGFYAVNPSPVDSSVWGSVPGFPGAIVRLDPGANPSETSLTEIYEPPWNNPKAPVQGYSPRGMDIDRNGVVWTALASGHLASFDRRKCQGPLNGPTATGQQCPEGWTLYRTPGPQFKGVNDPGNADSSYWNWVDQFDTLGLGKNVPIATGNGSDALLALLPNSGRFLVLRVPYPMGFYAKNLDGRIDDPQAGWKGRGVWSTYATRTLHHIEGGKGTTSKVVKFQLRPNPLAK